MTMNDMFRKFAAKASKFVGASWTFFAAAVVVAIWTLGGLLNGFNDTWLLIMNTVCSVTTFLIVFLIQNAQNRHTRIMQLKLDELIKVQRAARNDFLGMEEFTDQELDALQKDFHTLSEEFVERKSQLIKHRLATHHGRTPEK